ncbi:NADH-quinone oxidoreductase subunit L [Thermodesulfobacterium sp.]|jgi:NADH-quinone oxidoreductase subunit L|uniref:NADH-quinone oxidoreductase subunit L n=1 Tax=Thermodesulfobacterium sp. TaxID=1965289 RepID=UPI00257F9F4A|nr:NADH-quinone oxidoreductase subunit L [Thermodesulfobacterium sp.]MBZ4681555.1 NADH:ubiquinone oxidoreductase subunit [Thermodesulfobacterium sp.]
MAEHPYELITHFNLWVFLIPFIPLLGSLFTLIFGKKYLQEKAHQIPVLAIFISFLISLKVLFEVLSGKIFDFDLYTWISASNLKVGLGFLVDPLSIVMTTMVLSLSFLIHVYSIGYMYGDPGYYRFFSYISLFTFSMLMLVLSNNVVQLYLGWEAVGLCSYLLIGFWYEKKSAANAAKKAFIVNRVGDFGFALGVFALFYFTGALYYQDVFSKLPLLSEKYIDFLGLEIHVPFLIAFLLFCGAMGKSAQFPLHTWLPDAMEGPTPVSALIHAATMVTAGVFMVARLHGLFELSSYAMAMVAFVGAFTCFMAATIAPTRFDIKRIIAYSTMSQLGYMFMACGVGAFAAGIFHLFTHAYFKALLFLGAGSVIHAVHTNDIRQMGGLRKYMPYTFVTFMIGALALAGFPGLSGFFSKDEILAMAYFSQYPWGKLVWATGLLVAFLTAFYTFRLVFRVFFGEYNGRKDFHPHESPRVMIIPQVLIAVGAVFAGWLGVPHSLGGNPVFLNFLEPVLGHPKTLPIEHHTEYLLMVLSVMAAFLGIFLAWVVYLKKPSLQFWLSQKLPLVYRFLYGKWYFDELYDVLFVRSTLWTARCIVNKISDGILIEGAINGTAKLISLAGSGLRIVHSGVVNHYNTFILVGVIIYFILYFCLR